MDELMMGQAEYREIQRQLSFMDRNGWYQDLPKTRHPVGLRVVHALLSLATRLTPTAPLQSRTA